MLMFSLKSHKLLQLLRFFGRIIMQKCYILLLCLLVWAGCKKETKTEQPDIVEDTLSATGSETAAAGFSALELSQINFDAVMNLQLQIERQPENTELRRTFLENAYFKSNNALVTIGVGRLKNPDTGSPIARSMVKRAAQVDANRWAAYGLSWIKNDLSPHFGNLDTTFQGMQIKLMSFDRGDSLYLAVASEIQPE
jgi:hypothetical protein